MSRALLAASISSYSLPDGAKYEIRLVEGHKRVKITEKRRKSEQEVGKQSLFLFFFSAAAPRLMSTIQRRDIQI